MELCSQSGGNWLHQSEMQMSGIRAVNLEGFKNTACLDLELESVSTLMWSSEKRLFVLHEEDEAILLPQWHHSEFKSRLIVDRHPDPDNPTLLIWPQRCSFDVAAVGRVCAQEVCAVCRSHQLLCTLPQLPPDCVMSLDTRQWPETNPHFHQDSLFQKETNLKMFVFLLKICFLM